MGIYKRAAWLEAEAKQLKIENAELTEKTAELTEKTAELTEKTAELAEKNAALADENTAMALEIERMKILLAKYEEYIRLAQHRLFGSSSEGRVHEDQLDLGIFNEAEKLAESQEPEQSSEPKEPAPSRKKTKAKGKREEFYEGIPIRQVIHELPEDERVCPVCGGPLHACGHEVTRREVEVVPAKVTAVEHVQTVYTCRNCAENSDADSTTMVKSTVPAPVIPGSGIASPSLLSYVLCNKYVLGLPFYRQQQELERLGIYISRQTMSNWSIYAASHWLVLIYSILHSFLLIESVLHGDETITQVIQEDGRTASQKSYMWVYSSGKYAEKPIVLFEYKTTREGRHPLAFLSGFKGYLHTDAYPGYNKLTEQGVTLVRCWVHLRRKFDEALKALPKNERAGSPANVGIDYCNRLFKLEREYDEEGINLDERAKRRELESKPIAEAFFDWAKSAMGQTISGNKLFTALQYAINQQATLMNVFLDARLEFSNNRAERAIRPFAVGRKNWLFSFSSKGAESSAVIYSIIETAMANGLVPYLYLEFLLKTLPNIPTEQYADCLPWNPLAQKLCAVPKP
jgi:transposase/FtsZ-binding cell division protein ZapB